MKVILTTKNVRTSQGLKDAVEKKMDKLRKFFSQDIVANVMLSEEKNMQKVETTIKVKGTIFRAESKGSDMYEALDKAVDKLSTQMLKFKGKIQKKHRDTKEMYFESWPESQGEQDIEIVKTKSFELEPMSTTEAAMQMELLGHNFFVFLNNETKGVCVVYKRAQDAYGLLETNF